MRSELKFIIVASWGALGFYRGSYIYNNSYNNDFGSYNKCKNNPYFYTKFLCYGLTGAGFYIIPGFGYLAIAKEATVLESKIRGYECDDRQITSFSDYFEI